MSDLAILKADALQKLEHAWTNYKPGCVLTSRKVVRVKAQNRRSGPGTFVYALSWRKANRREDVLIEVDDWRVLDVVALAVWKRLGELRNRPQVAEWLGRRILEAERSA